jgi:hypothetical protein
LVYTLAQRQIRNALKESKSTIKNQLGKATNSPTLRWIFQCFQPTFRTLNCHRSKKPLK